VREVLESAVSMARRALDALGVDAVQIERTEQLYRSRDKERLHAQVAAGDLRVATDRIITQPARET
jgi:CPA2 family monovalent cation:H+ antiporter-2/glutathione-regulated potassium-efflux system protein KefB